MSRNLNDRIDRLWLHAAAIGADLRKQFGTPEHPGPEAAGMKPAALRRIWDALDRREKLAKDSTTK